MIAISLGCTVLLAGVWLVLWARDHQPPTYRTPEEVAADAARFRADRLMRQAIEDTATCEAIWNLSEIPSPRKETGQ